MLPITLLSVGQLLLTLGYWLMDRRLSRAIERLGHELADLQRENARLRELNRIRTVWRSRGSTTN